MISKLKNLYHRIDLWYWTSGAMELVDIASKGITFSIYFFPPMIMMMIGYIQLQELWGIHYFLLIPFLMIGASVVTRGALNLVKSGLL